MVRLAECACGQLKAECAGEPNAVVACHCTDCQKRTGSVMGVGAYYDREKVAITGNHNRFSRDGQEGRKFHNHFCPDCGTSLFWFTDHHPAGIGVAVGGFIDPAFPSPIRSVWEHAKHHWVDIPCAEAHFDRSREGK